MNTMTSNKWQETSLDQLGRIVTGKTPSSRNHEYFGGGIPFVTPSDFDETRLIDGTERHLTRLGADAVKGSQIPSEAVMVTCIGSQMGQSAIATAPSVTNQQINSIIVHPGNDALFIYYNLSNRREEIRSLASGSAVPILNKSAFGQLKISLPPLPVQQSIAHVLGTLDDKIEQNRRMNRTLEEMARAIYQDWFVDFGPTRAKMEDLEPYLFPELWGLFPDKLVDSEMGEIPEGWESESLGEIIELAYGKALKAGDRKGGLVPVYGSNGQVGWHDVKLVSGPGIIVGRKGNPGTVTWSHDDFFPIDTAFYVVPENPEPALHFLYYALTDQDLPSIAADSAVPGLNRNLAYMNKLLVPKRSLMEIYDSYVEELFIRMYQLEIESRNLTLQRNTLLPRLVSGELMLESD